MKYRYEVMFCQSGRLNTEEIHTSKDNAILAAREWIDEVRDVMKRVGAKKIGNLKIDNQIIFEHPAFGFEGGVYIHKQKYHSSYVVWVNI